MEEFKCVFDITGIDDHWVFVKDTMRSIFMGDYVITHNLFAASSEELYKKWNREFNEAKMPQESYEPFIAAKMNSWLDERINKAIPVNKRIFSWYSDPKTAQLVGVHNDYPDVTIRMHLEAK